MNAHSYNRIKCSGILHRALYSVKCFGVKGKYHKYIISNHKRCYNTFCPGGAKSITRIISRVTNDDNNSMAKGPANVESLLNERGAYSKALEIRCTTSGASAIAGVIAWGDSIVIGGNIMCPIIRSP